MLTKEQIIESIERAKLLVAAAKAAKQTKEPALQIATSLPVHAPAPAGDTMIWNAEQQQAIDHGFFGKSFCLIGSAGTGKTTTLRAILETMIQGHHLPPLDISTKHLMAGAPGVALISYTRRAVRNIAKQMSAQLKGHCITFHKLVEYEPEFYSEMNSETGEEIKKMRFAPGRHRMNPLPRNLKLIIVDEASMLSIDYFNEVLAALPNPSAVQFIFLGDLNQLPPVYGQAILGKQLLSLPIIELTQVYRQALESPIIAVALAVKDNSFLPLQESPLFDITDAVTGESTKLDFKNITKKTILLREGKGKVTLHPWKKVLDKDDALFVMQQQLGAWIRAEVYDPDEDLVLCPWNKSFGTDELNLAIADCLAKQRDAIVHEVISGYQKFYFAIGDKLLVDKQEAVILKIDRNPRYLGKIPQHASKTLNRWGNGGSGAVDTTDIFDENITDDQIDAMLAHAADIEDRTTEASHSILVRMLDSDEELVINKSAVLNNSSFAYAITVHKAQGSECRKVFLLTHSCHAAMCSRELIYTAITRAAEELYIVMEPKMLAKAASRPRIKGDSLAAKLEFFQSRLGEKEELTITSGE